MDCNTTIHHNSGDDDGNGDGDGGDETAVPNTLK